MEDYRLNKILLVDDDEEDYIIILETLHESEGLRFEVEWAADYGAALAAIETDQYAVILVDYHLGARNGLELLSEIISKGCKTPLILLTGQGDREVDIQAMNAGAADYLIKSRIDPLLLERSLRYSIQRRKDQESHEALEQEILRFQRLESIGRLAGGVAHELNNLLTPIIGITNLLLMNPTTGSHQKGDLQQIDKAAHRASSLV